MKEINKRDMVLIGVIIIIVLIATIIMVIPKNKDENLVNSTGNNGFVDEYNLLNLPFVEIPNNLTNTEGQETQRQNKLNEIVNTTLE